MSGIDQCQQLNSSTPHGRRVYSGKAMVRLNEPMAKDTYRLRLECQEVAQAILPGQFVMLRPMGMDDPLLGRPFALFDVVEEHGQRIAFDIGYHVVGKFTRWLAQQGPKLSELAIWGPLGNGFTPRGTKRLIFAAGGIGQTPFLAVAREVLGLCSYGVLPRSAAKSAGCTLCYGVRSAVYAAGVEEFRNQGVDVRISTDDGTLGKHGRVTDLVEELLNNSQESLADVHILTCGPEPMMAAVAKLAARYGVSCEASLETPMACGLGICFSCVTRIKTVDSANGCNWDYRRTCVEGPVFDAASIVWG